MHRSTQHIALYRKPGSYAGWPANYGIWSWQEEIVVSFTLGFYDADNGGFIVSHKEATARGGNGAQWYILRAA